MMIHASWHHVPLAALLLAAVVCCGASCLDSTAAASSSRFQGAGKAALGSGKQPPARQQTSDAQQQAVGCSSLPCAAAPKCCTRGRGAHSTSRGGGTGAAAGAAQSIPRSSTGYRHTDSRFPPSAASAIWDPPKHKGSEPAPAPLKRQQYDRYSGDMGAEARDQQLPGGCIMRQSLFHGKIVATMLCPGKETDGNGEGQHVSFQQTAVGSRCGARDRAAGGRRVAVSGPAILPVPPLPEQAAGSSFAEQAPPKLRADRPVAFLPDDLLQMAWEAALAAAEDAEEGDSQQFQVEIQMQSSDDDEEVADQADEDGDDGEEEEDFDDADGDEEAQEESEAEDELHCGSEDDAENDAGGFCMLDDDEEDEFLKEGLSVSGTLAVLAVLGVCAALYFAREVRCVLTAARFTTCRCIKLTSRSSLST